MLSVSLPDPPALPYPIQWPERGLEECPPEKVWPPPARTRMIEFEPVARPESERKERLAE